MRMAQTPEGLIPEIAPEVVPSLTKPFRDSPEWGSNAVILPWYVYEWYGDKQVLADNYDMMKRYLAYLGIKGNVIIYFTQGLAIGTILGRIIQVYRN
jgi:alpha-L-rhamnosidase